MAEHEVEIHQVRVGRAVRYRGVCSCGRWRTEPYATRTKAENLAEAHQIKGDEQNRAAAQFERGPVSLENSLKWYERQAADPLNSDKDRDEWSRLAAQARARLGSDPTENQQELF